MRIINRLLKAIREFEFLTIPLGLALWAVSVPFIHWLDPSAKFLDAGLLQAAVWVIVISLVLRGFNWAYLWLQFRSLYHYMSDQWIADTLNALSVWQRVWFCLAFYAVQLLFLSLLLLNLV